jgi:hypothetical protein
LLPRPCSPQISSSAPCSQKPSACVPQCLTPGFTSLYNRQSYGFVCFHLYIFCVANKTTNNSRPNARHSLRSVLISPGMHSWFVRVPKFVWCVLCRW